MFNRASRNLLICGFAMLVCLQGILLGFGGGAAFANEASGSVVVEPFESTSALFATSAQARSVRIDLVSRPETIHYGFHALKLTYDFTGMGNTSAAYVNFRDPSGATGRTMPGKPTRIGVWVYGDGTHRWLRGQLQDASGARVAIDFTTSSGLNWKGWRFVSAAVPATLQAPIKVNQLYIAETKADNKTAGAIYFDQLRAFYGGFDVLGLDIAGVPPLSVGETAKARVFATYANASAPTALSSGVTFASDNAAVASVDANGNVTAVGVGTAVLKASYDGAPEASYTVTVTANPVQPERLETSGPTKLEAGSSGALRVYAAYADSSEPVAALDGVTFASSDPAVAAVDASGGIAAVAVGTATIQVSYRGATTAHSIEVTAPVPVLQSIEVKGLSAMTVGETGQANVLGTYTRLPAPVDVTANATFASSDASVATISASGAVTTHSFGTTRITATFEGKTASHTLVVNNPQEAPKRELRAAWIATVDNIDWPRKGVTDAAEQQQDLVEILDELEDVGMNTVMLQIRPTADSFYPSEYFPWSEWLTGEQGQDPGYDPLAFAIEESRKRNLEFHAWINPYRISLFDDLGALVPDHPALQHPDWVVSYGGRLYFDPGIPEAKQYVIDGIVEVVENYDIDAIHFDDYIYPYPVAGIDFPDQDTYEKYGAGFANKAEWRRHVVNTFVQDVNAAIKAAKPHVKFGISPFSIWQNKAQHPLGSETSGFNSYLDLYTDSKRWVEEEWLDYVTPQVYWYIGFTTAAYDVLVEWWNNVARDRDIHVFIGQGAYRVGSDDPSWKNPDEISNQVQYNRNFDSIRGSMFYSAKWFADNPLGFADRLKQKPFRYPALVPEMPWLGGEAPNAPMSVAVTPRGENGVELEWEDGGASPGDETFYYVVYRFEGENAGDTSRPESIVAKVHAEEGAVQQFTDETAEAGKTYTYVVTAVNRLHHESGGGVPATVVNVPDTESPATAAEVAGEARNGWYVSDATVTLTVADNGAGPLRTEFSLDDGATWQPYAAPIVLTDDGSHKVVYRSADAAGNVETSKSLTLGIDRTAPTIAFEGARSYAVDEYAVVACTASDTVSGIVYDPCAGSIVAAPAIELGVGTHEASVNAVDAAGNVGTAMVVFTVEAPDTALLVRLIEGYVAGEGEQGIENSLIQKAVKGNFDAFENEVAAQTGKRLTAEQAAMLLSVARLLL